MIVENMNIFNLCWSRLVNYGDLRVSCIFKLLYFIVVCQLRNARLSSSTPIWTKKCSKMLSIALMLLSKSSTSKRTSLPISRKSSIRSTTPPGTALLAVTSAPMSLTRPSISSTSTWDKSRSSCSSQVDRWSSYPLLTPSYPSLIH